MNNNNFQQPPSQNTMSMQHQQQYNAIQQQYTQDQPRFSMSDVKTPYTNDFKSINDDNKNTVLPDYNNVNSSTGITPREKEQQQIRQRQQQQQNQDISKGYPGVVGGTPAEARGVQGYDAQGNPIYPPFIAQRHQIEQSLGPTCKDGGYHDLRMLLTSSSLLFAILIVPYCCGYRGSRVCTCTKCKQKFPNIQLPSPQ
ncbi:uncharacterized protein EV154DRAFT_63420 [Mucor mucedo]|uniref:uncharacterized protein n=1 Tax=Mucor mucedo TaxID=29922 RepID=UPI0022205DC1|nr:uncharacterized protein EV154DRAFT_63420 [Mucor mucedo]KAI7876785.1 hypothetical protein EV154DRAFT_63420 [Mucor mucedo]